MADIKVRIEVNPNAESEVLGNIVNNTSELANVSLKTNSSNVFQNVPTSEQQGTNGLSFSQDLVFDDSDYLDNIDLQGAVIEDEDFPTEFIWGIVPSSGEYSVKLTFTNAQNLKDIIVYGNNVVGQFPTRAIIDNKTEICSDDYRWAISLSTESDTHTIEFTHWNRANYNAVLTFIGVMLKYIEIDKRNGLKSVESLSQSTGQPKEIFYGVVPSDGSIEIIDIDGEIADMIKDGIIDNSNVRFDILTNGKQVQSHITTENSYSITNGSKTFSMQLGNTLSSWGNINYLGYRLNETSSLYDVLVGVLSNLYTNEEIDNMLDTIIIGEDNSIEETVKSYLQSIIITYPYLEAGTIRETVDKICMVAQLNVLQDDNGIIKFVSSRPLLPSTQKVIKVLKRNQLSSFDTDIIVKNKYKSVNVKYNQTALEDISLNSRTIKYYEYDNISQKLQDYNKVINDTSINKGITVLKDRIESENNPTDPYTGNQWYYYIAKFDVDYDMSNLKIMRVFNPKIDSDISIIFPNKTTQQSTIKNSIQSITPLDYSLTDNEIISEWLTSNNLIASGTPNFGFKVRKNLDGTFTVFYVSLLLITNKKIAYAGVNEDIIIALYNELGIKFLAPQITQSIISSTDNADITIEANELLQDTSSINGNSMPIIIKNNILNDYKDGISIGTISTNCIDYYDTDNTKIKDWYNGEIIEVGDVIKICKDNDGTSAIKYSNGKDMYFKVTGRDFKYSGVPLIDLELQEVKQSP